MAQENIRVKLPKAGIECEILPYVKHKLAKQVNKTYFKGQQFEVDATDEAGSRTVKVNAENTLDVDDVRVLGLLEVFGDKRRPAITQDDIDDLEEDDFDALKAEVDKVFKKYEKDNSPKKSNSGNKNTDAA